MHLVNQTPSYTLLVSLPTQMSCHKLQSCPFSMLLMPFDGFHIRVKLLRVLALWRLHQLQAFFHPCKCRPSVMQVADLLLFLLDIQGLDMMPGFCATAPSSTRYFIYQLVAGCLFLWDGGYPCLAKTVTIITAYKVRLQGRVQERFNWHHFRARSVVEQAIVMMKALCDHTIQWTAVQAWPQTSLLFVHFCTIYLSTSSSWTISSHHISSITAWLLRVAK